MRSEKYGPTMVVHLAATYNSLDDAVVERAEHLLLSCADQPDTQNLVVDLSHTQYFGSRFIETLFRAHSRMIRKAGVLALSGLLPLPQEVIRVSKLDAIWPLYATVEEAVRALGSGEKTR